MQRFLQTVASDLIERNIDPAQLLIVLPSRRAALFMEQYYAQLAGDGWLPQCLSMEDLLVELSGVEMGADVALLLELYEAYVQQEGIHAQSIKEFLKWAPAVLSDFNDIDLYTPNAKDLFDNLSDAKVIETWNPDGTPLTDRQKKYLSFWKSLPAVYAHFHARLDQRQMGYQGRIFRLALKKLKSNSARLFEVMQCQFAAFAGFNALTQAEEAILDLYKAQQEVQIYWDADDYYLSDVTQEAGDFLRKYIQRWPRSKVIKSQQMTAPDKQIRVHAIASASGQAILAGQLLERAPIQKPDDVAVILADESLLLPVLSAVPQLGQVTNVTMGYPLKWSPGPQLFKAILKLHDSASGKGVKRRFYFKHLFDVLNNPVLSDFPSAQSLKDELERLHWLYPTVEDLQGISLEHPDLFHSIFSDWSEKDQFKVIDQLYEIGQTLLESPTTAQLHGEGLNATLEILDQVKWHFQRYQVKLDFSLFRVLFIQLIDQVKLPFSGEPLSGLQIMGMLESRSLDFQHLIILSVNEGILPGGRSQISLIPPDIRKGHGLPNHGEKDKVYAYHFYRLIQRSAQVDLIYDTRQEALQSGEQSRFILQLEMEWAAKMPEGAFTQRNVSLAPQTELQVSVINKDALTMELLRNYLTQGISPSAINRFISCPLDFYYQYVIGIREQIVMEEDPEASTMGTLSHRVLELLYAPYVNQILIPELVKAMLPKVEPMLTAEFEAHFPKGGWKRGRPFIAFTAAVKEIEHLLRLDIRRLTQAKHAGDEVVLLGVETTASTEIDVNGQPAVLKGVVDRVQRVGQTIEVLDYKSGKVESLDVSIKAIEDLTTLSSKSKALQLLCYACFAWEKFGAPGLELRSANLTFKNHDEAFYLQIDGRQSITNDDLGVFKVVLGTLLADLLDEGQPFTHSTDAKYCLMCNG